MVAVAGPTAPSVSLLPPSPLQLCEGSTSLLCLLSGYSPQGALVSWTVDGSEVKDGVLTSAEELKKDRYSRSSTLTLSKDLWEKGEEFVCTVSHAGVNHPVMFRKTGPTVKPTVSLLRPSPLQLSEGSASLLCLLSGYSPQGALVSWTVDGSEVKDGVLTSAEELKKDGYTRSSTLTLSKDLWEKGEEFICTVSHNNVNHPVTFRKGHCEG
ncbi:hypothetical protein PGIGA_G00251770 [Pangasianodon gigas]|uniref:Uncharacterized protein n=1 Tax=Pangasianodon gigas TaxID=30993 RepID=A0ACC5WRX7_PANGG|nr:hypothetical protein [Pangasianodon gigas]